MKKYITPLLSFLLVIIIAVFLYNQVILSPHKPSPLRIPLVEARSRRFGFIIDVRTPQQRDRLGYYPNSVPISMERLEKEVPLDISNKNTWILVYSNGDDKARVAAEKLYEMGYPNVRYITQTFLSLLPGSQ
jgi:rhodanese-related sulfurtransferase